MTTTQSRTANEAYTLVQEIQSYFVKELNQVSQNLGENKPFEKVEWLRNEGENGGGNRFEARDESLFNRASVNVSHVHYDSDEQKQLGSASAISTIIHPQHPQVPSMHMHISWTEMKNGKGYWRIMGDLNPSIINEEDKETFTHMLTHINSDLAQEALKQGDKYFYIPALKRHRGVAHYYLENYNSGDSEADKQLARKAGKDIIDCYITIINNRIKNSSIVTKEEKIAQLEYHSLYLLQVLTLDRGTTSGLLVHNQNDVGIMGSIPSHVDPKLLELWITKMEIPQDELLKNLISVLPKKIPALIDEKVKNSLALTVRKHYLQYPQSLALQASGNIIPPTVQNHK